MLSLLTFALAALAATVPRSDNPPVVELSYGSFQGSLTDDLVSFLGMPYAAPPYVS